ncbi:universal stress protein [Pseudonocardia parietis]|uniref:Nucleotide-binding universal stress UspA family protein n=1 Tax=Pseudonocardia parietis TaxID=570936 RepID=A0ABS4VXG8_9PSEU|nr:universal stress protein [Pseudonocardia parietis]MBP2368169.1 nucleotide-binding universal stress UspA family protein [Pseudonocardia parietis]
MQDESPVLTGIDGSDESLVAVGWAAEEARRREAPLLLMEAVPWTSFRAIGLPWLGQEYDRDIAVRAARERLARAATIAQDALPPSRITHEVRGGSAAEVLHDASAGARLLVVGSRGRGGFAGLLAGSVAVTAASTAQCPVVVCRRAPAPGGPVVVGVGRESDPALEFAVEQAMGRGVPLVAVRAWFDETMDPYTEALLAQAGRQERALTAVAERTRAILEPWQTKYPGLAARERIVLDSPSGALVGESTGAQLVVVGSRGRGSVTGLLLGSTGQAVMRHAHCPVAVVRAPGGRHDAG